MICGVITQNELLVLKTGAWTKCSVLLDVTLCFINQLIICFKFFFLFVMKIYYIDQILILTMAP